MLLVGGLFLFVLPGRTYLTQRRASTPPTVRTGCCRPRTPSSTQRVQQLQTDAEIERLARQQYGLVKPGEEAYAILPPKQAPATPSAPRAHPEAEADPTVTPRWRRSWR